MNLLIKVTQDDIDHGKRSDTCFCPIALAFNRTSDRCGSVGSLRIVFSSGASFVLPTVAQNFVRDFDESIAVQPFEFYIAEPESQSVLNFTE